MKALYWIHLQLTPIVWVILCLYNHIVVITTSQRWRLLLIPTCQTCNYKTEWDWTNDFLWHFAMNPSGNNTTVQIIISWKIKFFLTHFMAQVSFYTPETIRKPLVLWCFQGYRPVAWNGLSNIQKSNELDIGTSVRICLILCRNTM